MSVSAQSQNSSNQLLAKLAVAARLLGKELHRLKLKRVDQARADLRLGEKAYASGTADGQAEFVSRVDGIAQRVTELRQPKAEAVSTFGEKAKVFASRIAKAVKVAALHLKRRRLLRQLGTNLRQSGANSSDEARSASAIAGRITAVETAITDLRPQTYPWTRRPLLTISLLLLLMGVGGAFMVSNQHTVTPAQQKGALSDAQMKKMLRSQQAFQQQLLQMQAEAHRREAEQTQARIAAAERQYREKQERDRAEVEKRQREAAAEQERVAAAERVRQEAQQREQERRITEEKARLQQQRQREAQEQRAKAEAVARAEQQTKQDIRKVAQAFVEALERNDTRSANSLASGNEQQLALAKAQHDFARSFVRMQLARAKKFGGPQASTFFDPSWNKAEEHIEGNKATVKNGVISYSLEKNGQTWKVNLPESSGADLLSVASSLTRDIDEITTKLEKGHYKSDKEAEDAFQAKVTALTAAQTSRLRSEDSLAIERWLRSQLAGGMTERQIVQISDLIAEKFASPEVSQIRERCFKGAGDQRQYDPKMLSSLSRGEYVPAAKPQAKRLQEEIGQMFPPRAVFETSITQWKAKALSPIEEPIQQGPKPPGSLVDEHLESFDNAMLHLADAYLSQRPYTGKSRLSYYNDVKSLQAGDVLYCRYESGDNFFHERPYFFWYRETPPGLENLLKTLPNDHPIRQIGPPLEEAPPTLDLAMKANVGTAEDVKKMMAESRARAQKEARVPKGTSYERGRDLVFKALGVVFAIGAVAEMKAQHDVAVREEELQKIIAASGGAKVRCPECKGSGNVLQTKWNEVSNNPFPVGTQPWIDWQNTLPGLPKTKLEGTSYLEKCSRCGGQGWVGK
jgi:flagellar biosynthesis GTPase FlhF